MKPVLLYFSTFLFLVFAKAQPVITSGGLVSVGDVFNLQYVSAENVSVPSFGANQVWDYSGLVDSNATFTESFIDPSTTPYAALFPGATEAVSEPLGSIPYYIYYDVTSTNAQLLGTISPGAGGGGDTVHYQPPLIEFQNPFTYNSFFRDSSNDIENSSFGVFSFPEIDSVYGIGYGALELPGSLTYSNVLEVETVKTTLGTQTFTIDFFVQGNAFPLLEIGLNGNGTLGNPFIVQTAYYQSNTTTPLTWLAFDAKADGNETHLDWQTATEINTGYFTVERSSDGVHFIGLQQVKASGKAGINTYTAADAQPLAGKNYYRIQETDKDGKYTYSSIIEITFNNNTISIMPNVILNGNLMLITNNTTASKAQLSITDMNGHILQSGPLNIGEGYNTQVINIDKLSAGKYFIIVNDGSTEKQAIPFIKQ